MPERTDIANQANERSHITNIEKSTDTKSESEKTLDAIKECRNICSVLNDTLINDYINKLFTDSKYAEYKIINIFDRVFYDLNAKVFFDVFADGKFYHGYDVYYIIWSKEKVLNSQRISNVELVSQQCKNNIVPMFAIVEKLEADPEISTYAPQTEVGYGTIYV